MSRQKSSRTQMIRYDQVPDRMAQDPGPHKRASRWPNSWLFYRWPFGTDAEFP
jgi:hypothetical protein